MCVNRKSARGFERAGGEELPIGPALSFEELLWLAALNVNERRYRGRHDRTTALCGQNGCADPAQCVDCLRDLRLAST
jgi:hypothetical protein